ncbi:hypothetical protein PoB_000549200 [Plakobranchus ocellatus]|uniref:C-type lectin domain-containing protein n=1 Tax=Plakobranchus ocellatus TaxID=259542 RepID=A0AAV3Y934_9GAST|nr:hypothetical protein PoB_000549200 [Plakobranchus ocellatus]
MPVVKKLARTLCKLTISRNTDLLQGSCFGPYFTGITDEGSEGRYYNFNDKSPAKYLKWRWFQSDNWWGKEHCVDIWVNNLNDVKCGRKGRHICEAA